MVASRDACPLCDKPFYGKQKYIRCGVCEIRVHCVCLQLGDDEMATVTATGESTYKCNKCAKELEPSDDDKTPAKSPESQCNHEGAMSSASSHEEASSLISVSSKLEAIRLNGKCTIELVESLVAMVSNLTKEVTHLKNDNVLLKEEIKNLRSIVEAPSRLPSQSIPREHRILPVEMSHKGAAGNNLVPTATLSTQVSPAIPIPAGMTFTELSYRDVAAAGISPPKPTTLPDADGFKTVTYRKKTTTNTHPAEIAAVNRVKPRRQPLIGVGSSVSLPVITKPQRSKALFVSRFSPEVTSDDVSKTLKEQLSLERLVCTKLKTKFNTYSSFHISVTEDEFSLINNTSIWPSGCLIAPYYGKLTPDQIFTTSTPEAGAPAVSIKSAAGNDGADGGSSSST
jgi:hypothetical protein